jgi:hypothetical protein
MIKYNPTYQGDPAVAREFLQIAAVLEVLQGKFEVLYEAPARPRDGQVAVCDGVSWNPIGDNTKRPVWFDGITWQAF